MDLKQLGEFGLIDRIRGMLPEVESADLVESIGDDCAVVRTAPHEGWAISTDLFLENVHFSRTWATPFEIGAKGMAVNLSDLAAMGARPRFGFVGCACPPDTPVAFLENLMAGLSGEAHQHGLVIAGGDTSSCDTIHLCVTVLGEGDPDLMLYRKNAHLSDRIFLTRPTGLSGTGLRYLMTHGLPDEPTDKVRRLLAQHLTPRPEVEAGMWFAREGVRTGIDISDGLLGDLGHIAQRSSVTIRLEAARLPLDPALLEGCTHLGLDPLGMACSGGEDYALAVSVPAERADGIAEKFSSHFGRELFEIGRVVEGEPGVELVDESGAVMTPKDEGWDHFG